MTWTLARDPQYSRAHWTTRCAEAGSLEGGADARLIQGRGLLAPPAYDDDLKTASAANNYLLGQVLLVIVTPCLIALAFVVPEIRSLIWIVTIGVDVLAVLLLVMTLLGYLTSAMGPVPSWGMGAVHVGRLDQRRHLLAVDLRAVPRCRSCRDDPRLALGASSHSLLGRRKPFEIEGREIIMTASVGVAISTDNTVGPATLVEHADMAMYEMKRQGRNGYRVR